MLQVDDALADLPLDEPMLLTELDGFLTGVLVCAEPIVPVEWLQNVWGADEGGVAPFDDPPDVQWFADAVMAGYNEIVRDLSRGKPQPIFDMTSATGTCSGNCGSTGSPRRWRCGRTSGRRWPAATTRTPPMPCRARRC